MARRRENVRLRRVVELAEPVRDVVEVAGALVWDRAGKFSIVRVLHDSGRRTYDVQVSPQGANTVSIRGLQAAGAGRLFAKIMDL